MLFRSFVTLDRVIELLLQARGDGIDQSGAPDSGPRVLDIGIGTGLLAERMPKGLNLYGIDISPKMMAKICAKGLPVKLKMGSFLDIPYPDGHFDAIVSTFAFHHLTPEEKERAYLEMHRVLSPGGLLIIADFMFENDAQAAKLAERFRAEGRLDMLEEFEEECFTYIDSATASLQSLGYIVQHERGSTLSWIVWASRATP